MTHQIPVVNQTVVQAVDGYKDIPLVLSNVGLSISLEKSWERIFPYWRLSASNNLMHSVDIKGSLDDQSTWAHGIWHNARGFMVSITPVNGERWVTEDTKYFDVDFFYQHKLPAKLRNRKNVSADKVAGYVASQLLKLTENRS